MSTPAFAVFFFFWPSFRFKCSLGRLRRQQNKTMDYLPLIHLDLLRFSVLRLSILITNFHPNAKVFTFYNHSNRHSESEINYYSIQNSNLSSRSSTDLPPLHTTLGLVFEADSYSDTSFKNWK